MKIVDAYVLENSKGHVWDSEWMTLADSLDNKDHDASLLTLIMHYDLPIAFVASAALLFSTDEAVPYSKFYMRAGLLQKEGLIPPEIDLAGYFATAYVRKISPEETLLALVTRGARRLKSESLQN